MQARGAAANNDAQQIHQNNVGLYNWQATKMTVKERLGFLFNSNILSDVTFVVGRGSQVGPIERLILHRLSFFYKLRPEMLIPLLYSVFSGKCYV